MSDAGGRIRQNTPPFIGRPLPRLEDLRLVAGKGRYTDDFEIPGQLWAAFVRTPHACANIISIETRAAMALPGVRAVLTGADYVAQGGQPLRHFADPADARDHTRRAFSGHEGNWVKDEPHLPLPVDRVRYVGEPVALVVADSANEALDAAEAVHVEYAELPCVVTIDAAIAPGSAEVDPGFPGNLCAAAAFGNPTETEAALSGAALVLERDFVNQRIANAQMEPRSVIASYDPSTKRYMMIAGSQGAVRQRDTLAAALGVTVDKVDVICPDVGGGFGPRTNLSPEQPMLALAARLTECPVRWTSTRSEAFLTDYQGRDMIHRARIGFDADGRIVGYACEILGNVGAYTVSFVPMANSFRVLTTVYRVPAAAVSIRGVLTNTVPTAPYRGAGRPESTYVIERLLDIAAQRLGLDRIEIRRRNLIDNAEMPYTTAMGLTYDSGAFLQNMAAVLRVSDWDDFPARRSAAERRGRLAGIGLANYVESPVGIPHERVDITVLSDGRVEVVTGTQSTGQGHETSFAQVIADQLGVSPEAVSLISGDTRRVVSGGGSHSDRSMRIGGMLLVQASQNLIARALAILENSDARLRNSLRFEDGRFCGNGSNQTWTIFDIAKLADDEDLPESLRGPLCATASFTGRVPAYPTGAAVCELEIDPQTGVTEVKRYTSIDDVGQPINPLILHGQVHGGIVQGIGQALAECVDIDSNSGQGATGSFMDYALACAESVPSFTVDLVEDPTYGTPLRVKGGGESGITPSLASTINAVVDALSGYNIEHIDMPATPHSIWSAIQAAKRGAE
jgi:carbon-monoxide dehydrogenase large subunit